MQSAKTHPVRIKQSAFHIFNSFGLLAKFRIRDSIKKLTKGIKFFLSNEDWWVFDKLLTIEKSAGITAVYNFYSDTRSKNFKRWLMDPSYNVKSDRVKSLLRQLKHAGHEVGLHPTYDAWDDSELIEEQKKTLEKALAHKLSIADSIGSGLVGRILGRCQANAGLRQDSTLMFNDRSGFRNSCATSWNPWDQIKGKSHSVSCITSVVMDSHLFDYSDFNDDERNKYMKTWLNECKAVGGQASFLWHPQTLTKDYGWSNSFKVLLGLLNLD